MASANHPPSPPPPASDLDHTSTPAASSSPSLFVRTANAHLSRLQSQYNSALLSSDPQRLHDALTNASAVRRAAVVHRAVHHILSLPSNTPAAHPNLHPFLRSLLPRLHHALVTSSYHHLSVLSTAAQRVLDATVLPTQPHFQPILPAEQPASVPAVTSRDPSDPLSDPLSDVVQFSIEDDLDPNIPPDTSSRNPKAARSISNPFKSLSSPPTSSASPSTRSRLCCGLSFSNLSNRDRLVLILYLLMVIASIIAMTLVTVEFVRQTVNPSGFIETHTFQNLSSPVVTVCLSRVGVPFSRLQLFNYTDAAGTNFLGADPRGPQDARASPEFSAVVDRFWENPDNEDCFAKVGDFFPFPIRSLNALADGSLTTKCRQCYRVGARHLSFSNSTAFQNSSTLSLYTDNYFLQCQQSPEGLNEPSREFLYNQMVSRRDDFSQLGILTVDSNNFNASSAANLSYSEFATATSDQLCNMFYFAFFPKLLKREDPDVDVRYIFNGSAWAPIGTGPYFLGPNNVTELPVESLQMFVESNDTAVPIVDDSSAELGRSSDMILIGPNTQTFASFRRVDVFGRIQYELSSSTSNLWQSDITPLFGYWLLYKVFFNYNRFIVDKYYTETTYPAAQWLVDLTGYATLFTGASLFSLLLLPLLRTMRRREKTRLLQQKPEGYVWSKYRKELQGNEATSADPIAESIDASAPDRQLSKGNVLLPGFNV